jgi:excisionase family DNA binding protein
VAGYRTAEAARVQALRRDDRAPAPPPAPPEGSYSISEAADLLGVSAQTIYDWIRAGRIEVALDRPRGRRVYLPERSTPSD